jgi:phosphatidylglycerol lysyltransferase
MFRPRSAAGSPLNDTGAARNDGAARRLVLEHGWCSTCYQILNPGIRHWFSSAGDAVAGYVRRHRTLVVAGAPVCRPERLAAVASELEAQARASGLRVCYVCAEDRLDAIWGNSPHHARVMLGAQPVWDPSQWEALARGRRALRQQIHRARNKDVRIEPVEPAEASRDPQLRTCVNEWLAGRPLPPLHFLVEPLILDGVLDDRMILVARRAGKTVAVLVASPIPIRNGYLIEQVARSANAPNGTAELLIDHAMRSIAAQGRRYVTLGLVALADELPGGMKHNPWWMRRLIALARAHANRFYNFRGLLQFRRKLGPERWEGVYAIVNEPKFSPGALYDLGGAFSGISPALALAIGVAKAAGQEARWMAQRLRHIGGW